MTGVWSILTLALVLATVLSGHAGEEDRITRNPFVRPEVPVTETQISARLDGAGNQVVPLELRATFVSADWGMAMINGSMIESGDEIEGYRLLKIREGEVVMIRAGKRKILKLQEVAR